MGINFNVKFDVKRKFKYQGKEYDKIEDAPPEAQDAFRKAQAESGIKVNVDPPKITYNGKQYSLDELPPHVKEMYEKLMKMKANDKSGPIEPSSSSEIGSFPEPSAAINPGELPNEPMAPKAFSSWFKIVLILIAIGMIYMIVSRLHY
ncbi:MAG: hypothetical protein PHE84_05410 [bacterium]|nr:hypothetical protein [bacterium]